MLTIVVMTANAKWAINVALTSFFNILTGNRKALWICKINQNKI